MDKTALIKEIEEMKKESTVCIAEVPTGHALLSSGYICYKCPYKNECKNGNMAWKLALDKVLNLLNR